MFKGKTTLIALCLSALCFVVVGVGNAAAKGSTLHECKKPLKTEFPTEKRYKDAECKEESKTGEFATVPIIGSQSVTATSTSSFVLSSEPFGIKNKITCTTMMSSSGTAENSEVGGVMKISGTGVTEFTGCTVNEPAGCTVTEPIKTVSLKATSEDNETTGVMRTLYEPKEGTTFTTITLGNCGLLNGGHNVQGKARSQQVDKTSEEFSSTSGSELTFFGFSAGLTGKLHYSTPDGTKLYRETSSE